MTTGSSTDCESKLYPPGHHRQFDANRRSIAKRVFHAMVGDYGPKFTRQFEGNGELAAKPYDWKCRLLELAKPFGDETLVDAVDNCCRMSPDYPPALRLIESEMRRLKAEGLKSARDAETLRRAREPADPTGRGRMAAEMRRLADALRHRPAAPPSREDELDRILAYEVALYPCLPDGHPGKTLPRTREFCMALAGADPGGASPASFAVASARRQGGETQSMFRQITDYLAAA